MVLALVANSLILVGERQPDKHTKIIYLLPANFHGWVCVEYGVRDSPPLPREGSALIVRPRPGQVLKTSDKPGEPPYFPEAWFEENGQRRHLPEDVYERRVASLSDSNNPVVRYCSFYGTIDEADAAEDPPGFKPSRREAQGILAEERQALVDLYLATDGDHWTHHVGWLGPLGPNANGMESLAGLTFPMSR